MTHTRCACLLNVLCHAGNEWALAVRSVHSHITTLPPLFAGYAPALGRQPAFQRVLVARPPTP